MRSRTLHKLISVASVAAFAAVATATTSAGATATDSSPSLSGASRPTAAAIRAGITAPGEAYMGWSNHTTAPSTTTKPDSVAAPAALTASPQGMDVASFQGNVAWQTWYNSGMRFAYVKATESTTYINPYYTQQYNGSYNVGMIRGAYHFALPDKSGGATQADYFLAHGGGWTKDGMTLPGALDIEYNPYGATCYGLSHLAMKNWITAFSDRYRAVTSRNPVIYTTTDWWTSCTGNSVIFSTSHKLWLARYASTVGPLPGAWVEQRIWQYTSAGGMDKNWFNGDYAGLKAMATG
ncbi:MAG: GH25 family lysozyme [Propionicimonas sp.]